MSVEVSGALLHGVTEAHMPFEPLVQIAGLSDIDRDPGAVVSLFGVDVVARQWPESSVEREDLILILLAGLTRPTNQSRTGAFRLPVMRK